MYPEPPDPGSVPSCAEGGVVGVLPGIIGTMQANEVIKLILGTGIPAIGKLTTFGSMDFDFRTFKLRRDPACPVCGDHPTITAPIDYEQFCGVPALDPKSLEETRKEVSKAKGYGEDVNEHGLDALGLPQDYSFNDEWEITPRDVKSKLDKKEKFVFIDCRLPNEAAITKIDGAKLIPLQQLPNRLFELKGLENEPVVVHCRSGQRSLNFAHQLKNAGFKDVRSMAGGILLWNKDVNPGGPQY